MTIPYPDDILNKLHKEQLSILSDLDTLCKTHNIPYFALYGTAIGAVRHKGFIPWDDDVDIGMLRKDYIRFLDICSKNNSKYVLSTPLRTPGYSCTVTHFQKKGTRFVQRISKDKDYFQGINIDIFPFDKVAPTKPLRKRQQLLTTLWGKLLFLRGCASPVIETYSWIQRPCEIICKIIHYALCFLHIKSETLFTFFQAEAMRYENTDSKWVTSFEYTGSIRDSISLKNLFPLNFVSFEDTKIPLPANNDAFLRKIYGDYFVLPDEKNRINHCPYLIEFSDGETKIFL